MRKFFVSSVACLSAFACADPIVLIGDSRITTWGDGIANGNVTPVTDPLTVQTKNFYTNLAASNGLNGFQQQSVRLTPDFNVSDGTSTRRAMVMSWDQPDDQNTLGVGSWEWGYHADPDLTGFSLAFEALAPKGVYALGVELIDANGLSKGWYREKPLPATWDSSYALNLSGGLQGPFTAFGMDAGFDLTTVLNIRFNEASLPSDPFVVADPTGNGSAWNAWSYLDVVPEPNPSAFLGVASLALIGGRRYGRAKPALKSER